MAFVRKKGKSFYLVHNVREDGRVRQVHLACLGNRPRVSDEIVEQVAQAHPHLQIDWQAVRNRAAETFAAPFTDAEGVRQLARTMRGLELDLEELSLPLLRERLSRGGDNPEALIEELLREMERLRTALEARLKQHPASTTGTATGTAMDNHGVGD